MKVNGLACHLMNSVEKLVKYLLILSRKTYILPFTPQCKSVTSHKDGKERLLLNVCHLDRIHQNNTR